jgi:PAS domain-containing protein
LVINEGLYYGTKLDHSLLNPNQCRAYGIDFWDNPYDKERGLRIDADESSIALKTKGTKIFFKSRSPSQRELQNCHFITLTSKTEWNPSKITMSETQTKVENDDTIEKGLKERLLDNLPRGVATLSRYGDVLEDVPTRQTYTSTERHLQTSAEVLADRFAIGLQRAKDTIRATHQRSTRSAILPISRRYRADRRFAVKRLSGKFATDTLWAKCKSLNGNVAAQIYSNKCRFNKVYPMDKANNQKVGESLKFFINDFGAADELTYDGAAVQVGRKTTFQSTLRQYDIKSRVSGPRRPNENPAEGAIREVKKRWYRLQSKHDVPDRLWDYGIVYICETGNLTVNSSRYSGNRTPLEIITGDTPDISEYMDFGFYEWVTYRTNAGLGKTQLGRWLGVSHRVGQLMSYWILPISGIPISCTTVQRLTNLEKQTDAYRRRMDHYQTTLDERWAVESADISASLHKQDINPQNVLSLEDEDEEFLEEFKRVINNDEIIEEDDSRNEPDPEESYVGMELGMRSNEEEEMQYARVKRRAIDEDGKPIGKPARNNNQLLDSRQYEIEYADGRTDILTANVIAENLLAQVNEEGQRHLLIDEIEDHRTSKEAIPKEKGTYKTKRGLERPIRTTKGWEFYVRWKDGSADWVTLKDLKDSYPVPLADYAVANDIQDEPALAWWVPYTLKKRIAIISKVKSKYWQRTHKYGIRVPKTTKEAIQIDLENNNTLWQDAIALEMKNNRVAFEEHHGDVSKLIGYEEITGHIIFDVKLSENFRRKARFVADGHRVETPASITYSTVVYRDSVRILLTIAALNDLDVQGADVQNAFLSADNLERHWIRAGPEFGDEEGKVFIVRRALYGLKSASAAFRSFMAKKLDEIGFRSSPADPDVWIRPAVKPDGFEYYEYVMMYVDDILAISHDAKGVLESMQGDTVKYKNGKIEPPTMYLGARLQKKPLNGLDCWAITSVDYVNAAVKTVKESLEGKRWKLPGSAKTPMTASYYPELDTSPELGPADITFYQEMIGMLRWAVELGRVDINHEISILSQHQASPRQGHLEQILRIVAFLEKKPKLSLYMNPELPKLDYSIFHTDSSEFKEYYRDAEEELPHRMPEPRGLPVTTTAFVDASHGANKVTRRSHSGHILFVNRAPVKWYSKRQQTVETSAFSSEFIALKHCIEDVEHLRFKLRMFGIPLDPNQSETSILCDNESMARNTSNVESSLNKKHSAIAYHFARWNVAAGVCKIAWIPTGSNIADAMTKRLPEATRDHLFGNWTY